jgi:hypothetical protein
MATFFQHTRGVFPAPKSHTAKKPISKKSTDGSFIKVLAPRKITTKSVSATKDRYTQETDTKKNDINIEMDRCDIVYIDEQIIKNLRCKITSLPRMYKHIGELSWILNNSPDALDRMMAKTELETYRKKVEDIEGGFELSLYLSRTLELVDAYKSLTDTTQTTSFIKTKVHIDNDKVHRRNSIIVEYIRIAKEYINLENYKQKVHKPVCPACHSSDLTPVDSEESFLMCKCGNIVEQLDDAPTFKDSERVNMSSRYTYTCRGHFIEAMNRFEGKQNTDISITIIDILKKEVHFHNLTPDTATKDHIYMFLTEKKLSDYYADINLIYFLITNKNPPDITDCRNELLEMHDQLEDAYQEVKDDDRLNSLNVNWKLYKLLQLLDYPCKKDDFFCLKTPTKQGEHEQKWYDMIEYLKSKYPNAMTSHGKKRWRHIRTL